MFFGFVVNSNTSSIDLLIITVIIFFFRSLSNIGFGEGATHTIGKKSILENIPRKTLNFPLEHPSHMVRNFTADSSYIRAMFKPHRSFKW